MKNNAKLNGIQSNEMRSGGERLKREGEDDEEEEEEATSSSQAEAKQKPAATDEIGRLARLLAVLLASRLSKLLACSTNAEEDDRVNEKPTSDRRVFNSAKIPNNVDRCENLLKYTKKCIRSRCKQRLTKNSEKFQLVVDGDEPLLKWKRRKNRVCRGRGTATVEKRTNTVRRPFLCFKSSRPEREEKKKKKKKPPLLTARLTNPNTPADQRPFNSNLDPHFGRLNLCRLINVDDDNGHSQLDAAGQSARRCVKSKRLLLWRIHFHGRPVGQQHFTTNQLTD
ncbi:hypothetical protein T4E_8953 [Trichinella pseudospiralis]|uniref:Uncharacterized protein n=1 Tax=Trichinella pseudospiralis TaxID=6337 RepID=A0A0V0XN67_TRIPS|nr:hypothetical protein T4E_8953 [Trichinella pseudospiralis]